MKNSRSVRQIEGQSLLTILKARVSLAIGCTMVLVGSSHAGTFYVSPDSANDGPGTAWSNAFHAIQGGVDAAGANDTVVVGNGVYDQGGTLFSGLTNRVLVDKAITLRSQNGPGVTTILGAADPTSTNGPSGVRCMFVSDCAFIAGFTLSDGHSQTDDMGGGLSLAAEGVVVSNCVIASCSAGMGGGVGAFYNCAIIDSIITNCSALAGAGGGGGVLLYSGGSLDSCTISDSTAEHSGGGVSTFGGMTVVHDCLIERNHAKSSGGGLFLLGNATVMDCTIRNNSCDIDGGGLITFVGEVERCILADNAALGDGGGSYLGAAMRHCLLTGNVATNAGGGLYLDAGLLEYCTISSNHANKAGGVYIKNDESNVSSSIIYGNTDASVNANWAIENEHTMMCFYPYNCTTPLMTDLLGMSHGGTTNDPDFVDAQAGDYHLQPGSPCIDRVQDSIRRFRDLDGRSRPLDGDNDGAAWPDMGCYEFLNSSADSDEDGWTDGVEESQSTDPQHNDSAVFAMGCADVINNPSSYDLYTSNSIIDLNMGGVMIQSTSGTVNLMLQLKQCTNLVQGVWTNVGPCVQWQTPAENSYMFYRVRGF